MLRARPNLTTFSIAIIAISAFIGAAAAEPGKGRGQGGGGGGGHGGGRGAPAAPMARPAPAPHVAAPRAAAPRPQMMARPASAPRAMPQRAMPQRAMRPAPAIRDATPPRYAAPHRAARIAAPSRPPPQIASQARPAFTNRVERRAVRQQQAAQPRITARERAAERLQQRQNRVAERAQQRQIAVQNRLERLQQRAERGRLGRADRRDLRRLERAQRVQPATPALAREGQRANRAARVTPQRAMRERFAANFVNSERGARRFERGGRLAAPAAWRQGSRAAYVPWRGPVYWPYAYTDIFLYAFWPDAYEPAYWAYAYDDFYDGIFFPDGAPYIDYAYQGPYYRSADVRYTTGSARARAPGRLDQATRAFCAEQAKSVTALPFARIEEAVRPHNDQKALFADLRKAAADAAAQFRDACPDAVPLTPLGRLEAMTLRLDPALAAIRIIRPSLAAFYESLTDEQKARFNEIGPDLEREPRAASQDGANCRGGKAGLAELPIDSIEAIVQPTRAQEAALARLHDAIAKSVVELSEACAVAMPGTPVGRLDAMEKRLEAMLSAAQEIRPALGEFYASLDDEQKAKFNRLSRVAAQSQN